MDAKDEDAGLMSILGVGRRRMDASGEVVRPDPENDDTEWVGQDGDDGGGLSAVTMGDPAEVVATTPVVGTAMMTAMVMMATIMAMMVRSELS